SCVNRCVSRPHEGVAAESGSPVTLYAVPIHIAARVAGNGCGVRPAAAGANDAAQLPVLGQPGPEILLSCWRNVPRAHQIEAMVLVSSPETALLLVIEGVVAGAARDLVTRGLLVIDQLGECIVHHELEPRAVAPVGFQVEGVVDGIAVELELG